GVVALVVQDHPHRSVLDLGGVPLGHDRHPDSSGSGMKAVTLQAPERRTQDADIDYLFTSFTATARPGCVEVPDVSFPYRLPISSTGVVLTWSAPRRAPLAGSGSGEVCSVIPK
ncbi:hypothetical protein, partial [Kineococcus esterisolvens]|uniref:hypothetical protein n=2 Tax=Kineococcus TaxID=33981 RepID=UPI003D7D51E7